MRKFISIILTLTMVFSICVMSVNANSYVFELGTPTKVSDTQVSIPVIFNLPDDANITYIDGIQYMFNMTGCKIVGITTSYEDYFSTPETNESNFTLEASGDGIPVANYTSNVIANITVENKRGKNEREDYKIFRKDKFNYVDNCSYFAG